MNAFKLDTPHLIMNSWYNFKGIEESIQWLEIKCGSFLLLNMLQSGSTNQNGISISL